MAPRPAPTVPPFQLSKPWDKPTQLLPYVCGWCGDRSPGAGGLETKTHFFLPWRPGQEEGTAEVLYVTAHLRICEHCGRPTFIETFHGYPELTRQHPSPAFGAQLASLPADLSSLYEEARRCMSVYAYTSAVMIARKMLLHIAAERGAPKDALERFVLALKYLEQCGEIPKSHRRWVDRIKDVGNDANHEIRLITRQEAEDVMQFTEMLLKVVYVLPAVASSRR